jgi:hypothetical protein
MRKNFNKWWCGYNPCYHKLVILDDYPGLPHGDALQHHLKLWADRYPITGEVKGSSVVVETGRWAFIITSNYPIEKCFSKEEDIQALKRRFREIKMTKANACLINRLRIDWEILSTRKKQDEEPVRMERDLTLEEYTDLVIHEEEERMAKQEAQDPEKQRMWRMEEDEEW